MVNLYIILYANTLQIFYISFYNGVYIIAYKNLYIRTTPYPNMVGTPCPPVGAASIWAMKIF